MNTNELPTYDASDNPTGCCPRFKPNGWDGQDTPLRWQGVCASANTKSVSHSSQYEPGVQEDVCCHRGGQSPRYKSVYRPQSRNITLVGRALFRGDQGGPGRRDVPIVRAFYDQGFRRTLQECPEVGAGNGGRCCATSAARGESILLLYDMPEMREAIRQELRGGGGASSLITFQPSRRRRCWSIQPFRCWSCDRRRSVRNKVRCP